MLIEKEKLRLIEKEDIRGQSMKKVMFYPNPRFHVNTNWVDYTLPENRLYTFNNRKPKQWVDHSIFDNFYKIKGTAKVNMFVSNV